MQKRTIIIGISIALGVLAFIYLFSHFSLDEITMPLENASLISILGFILVSFLISIAITLRWHIINKSLDIDIPFGELYRIRLAGYCISYVTPGPRVGGTPVMATLMKKRGIDYLNSVSGMVIDKIFDITTLLLVFLVGSIFIIIGFRLPNNADFILFIVALFLAVIVALFYIQMIRGKEMISRFISFFKLRRFYIVRKYELRIIEFENLLIRFYNKERKAFYQILVLTFILIVLMYFEYATALDMLGIHATVLIVFLIVALTDAALLIPIPGAIGSMEAGQISALALAGLKSSLGFTLALIIRVRDLIWVILGFGILFYYGMDFRKLIGRMFRKYVRTKTNVKIYLHK